MKNSIKLAAVFTATFAVSLSSWAVCNWAAGDCMNSGSLTPIANAPVKVSGAPAAQAQEAAQTDGSGSNMVDVSSQIAAGGSSEGSSGGQCALMTETSTQTQNIRNMIKQLPTKLNSNDPKYQQTITCLQQLNSNTSSLLTALSSADSASGKNLCTLQSTVANGKYGMTNGMMSASSTASTAQTSYIAVGNTFENDFKSGTDPQTYAIACSSVGMSESSNGPSGNPTSDNVNDSITTNSNSTKYGFCTNTCGTNTVMASATVNNQSLQQYCIGIASTFEGVLQNKVGQAACYSTAYSTAGTALKIGVAAVGVAAVAGIAAAIVKHHKDETRDSAQTAYNNAIIKVNGQNVDCKQSTTYTASQCQAPLMNYCSLSANTTSAGCGAFNTYYCAQSGSSVSYCLSSTARSYCGNTVSTVSGLTSASSTTVTLANSPSCQWLSGMPSNCAGAPTYTAQTGTTLTSNQLSCLTAMSASQLAATCPNYTSDPLCQAYNSGQVVYQSSGATGTVTAAVGTTTSTLPAAAGSTTSSSTSITSTATNVSTTNLGGFTGVGKVVTRNMFAESSSTLSSLCHSGSSQLIGCH